MESGSALLYPGQLGQVEDALRKLVKRRLGTLDTRISVIGFLCKGRSGGDIVDTLIGKRAFGPTYSPKSAFSSNEGGEKWDEAVRMFLPEHSCRIEAWVGTEGVVAGGRSEAVSKSRQAVAAAARGAAAARQGAFNHVNSVAPGASCGAAANHGFVLKEHILETDLAAAGVFDELGRSGLPVDSAVASAASKGNKGKKHSKNHGKQQQQQRQRNTSLAELQVEAPVIYLRLTSHSEDLMSSPGFDEIMRRWQTNGTGFDRVTALASVAGQTDKKTQNMMTTAEKMRVWVQSCDDCFLRAKIWMMLLCDAVVSVDARDARCSLNTRLCAELRCVQFCSFFVGMVALTPITNSPKLTSLHLHLLCVATSKS